MPQRLLGIGVNEFPVSVPVATPTAWQGPTIQGTATFTNGSANVTVVTTTFPSSQFVGTDNMGAGQPVYGGLSVTGGLPTGVVINTITSATVFTLALPLGTPFNYTGTTGTYPYQIGVIDPNQSGYSFSTNGNAIEPVTNVVADSYLSIPNTQTVAVNGHYYIPPGQGICLLTSGSTTASAYQYQVGAVGTWNPIFTGTAAAATSFMYISDGQNFRINNPGTTAATAIFIQTN
jgi:hypothetical protein